MNTLRNYILEQVAAGGLSRDRAAQMLAELVALPKSTLSMNVPHNEIAIVGMACRFPPHDDLDGFWASLAAGIDLIRPFPKSRRQDINALADLLESVSPNLASRFKRPFFEAAYLDQVDLFDYTAFRIAPEEARLLDPQQRLLLEVVHMCLENANYSRDVLYGSKVGVYIAYAESEYAQLIPQDHPSAIHATLPAMLAGRISYLFDWHGPSQVIETTCSSSLVALHNACQALLAGDCEIALAGGVQLLLLPFTESYADFEQIGIRSPDGRTRTFDSAASGTGNGEGVGIVMLKPLAKALKDGDYIHAIIKGSAVNSDGRSSGVTAPNPKAQTLVITEAWLRAGIDPTTISYIEAHGTATRLGDPIEIQGITSAFRQYTDRQAFCAIGSVKTNLGHLNATAGIAGLIKTVLALKHRQIPPSLHFKNPNPLIPFANSPVFVNHTLRSWDTDEGPRRAGVSAFGLSGTNCHVILEEAPKQDTGKRPYRPSTLTPHRCWQPVEASVQALLSATYKALPESHLSLNERQSQSADKLKWLYTVNWIMEPLATPVASVNIVAGIWLLLVDDLGFGAELASKLRQTGNEVILVFPGTSFQQRSAHNYQVRPTSQADWGQLFKQLALIGTPQLTGVVHLWTCTNAVSKETLYEGIEQQDTGVLSLFALFQQVIKVPVCKPFTIWIVSNFVQRVTKEEEILFPAKATLWGFSRVIPQEYYWVQCYCLDVDVVRQKNDEISKLIFNEMFQDITQHDYTVVYRQGRRFVQQLERINLDDFVDREQPVVKENGIYLLAGGIGYIGLGIARYLAQQAHVRLILINRTPLPERASWPQILNTGQSQDRVVSRLHAIAEIEKLGSEVTYIAADIGDPQAMKNVVEDVLKRYGRINGVINATMQLQEQKIEDLSQENFAYSILNRLKGAYVLDQATRTEKLDFFIIISSLSSLFGGIGQADDVSANLFLDAYGAWMEQRGQEVSVLNLPGILEQRPASLTVGERILPAISSRDMLEMFALLIHKKTSFVMIEDFDFQEIKQVLPILKVRFAPELLTVKSAATQKLSERLLMEVPVDGWVHSRTLVQQIAEVWSKVLGYPEINPHENFFDLGGDSLIAMRVIEKLRETPDTFCVAIADLFKHPTIAALASCIEQRTSSPIMPNILPDRSPGEVDLQQQSSEFAGAMKPLVLATKHKEAPLSFIQEKLWFLDQLLPGTTVNNVTLAYRLAGPLDLPLVVRCINALVQRHEILHTLFIVDGERPVQRIVPMLAPDIEIMNLQALTAQEQDIEVRRLATAVLLQPFNLAHGPLLRGKLVILNEREHVIALAVHHIVFDGWSIGIFLKELAALYEAFSQGRPSPLPPLPFQYADFAHSQRQQLQGHVLAELVAFWRQRLAGATALELPTDYPRTQQLTFQGEIQPIIIPFTVVKNLQSLSQQEHSILFITVLAAFFALLRLYTQQDNLVIGVISANRKEPGANKLIGAFVNTLIMRLDCADIFTFRELLTRVRQVVLEVSEHQVLTSEQMLEAIDPHNPLQAPLIRVVFNFYANPLQDMNFFGMLMTPIEIEKKTERYDISLEIADDGEQGLSGFISYNTSLFKPTTIARMARQFETFLRNIASEPDMSI